MALEKFKIKEEYKSTIVGFNNSGLPLGEREDLDKLAELAHTNPGLAKYFEKLPSMRVIMNYRAKKLTESGQNKDGKAAPEENDNKE